MRGEKTCNEISSVTLKSQMPMSLTSIRNTESLSPHYCSCQAQLQKLDTHSSIIRSIIILHSLLKKVLTYISWVRMMFTQLVQFKFFISFSETLQPSNETQFGVSTKQTDESSYLTGFTTVIGCLTWYRLRLTLLSKCSRKSISPNMLIYDD